MAFDFWKRDKKNVEKFLFKIFKALLEKRYTIFLLDKELIFVETEIFTKKII